MLNDDDRGMATPMEDGAGRRWFKSYCMKAGENEKGINEY